MGKCPRFIFISLQFLKFSVFWEQFDNSINSTALTSFLLSLGNKHFFNGVCNSFIMKSHWFNEFISKKNLYKLERKLPVVKSKKKKLQFFCRRLFKRERGRFIPASCKHMSYLRWKSGHMRIASRKVVQKQNGMIQKPCGQLLI